MKVMDHLATVLVLLVVAAVAAAVGTGVLGSTQLPEGPAEVTWDHEVCAHCRMHVGDPAFAAQVQTVDGRVLCFDDPGCAFLHLEAEAPEVHATYFRQHDGDRWLAAAETVFVRVAQSPMGFGFAAAAPGTARAVSLSSARQAVLQRGGR